MCRPRVLVLFRMDLERHEKSKDLRKVFVRKMMMRYNVSKRTIFNWIKSCTKLH